MVWIIYVWTAGIGFLKGWKNGRYRFWQVVNLFFSGKTRREILRNVTSQEGSFRTLGNKGHWVFWWWGQWWWCCCASSIEKWSSISSHVLTTDSMYGFQCCVEGSRGVKRKQWAHVVWIDCRPKTSAHQHGQSIFEYDDLFSGWWVQQGRQVDGDRHFWCVQGLLDFCFGSHQKPETCGRGDFHQKLWAFAGVAVVSVDTGWISKMCPGCMLWHCRNSTCNSPLVD